MTSSLTVTVLGCGGSDGVPLIGGDSGQGAWGRCDPDEPKNRRTRSSIHVSDGETAILIDTSPDLRQQLLDTRLTRVDAVLYTHEHADHTHGINELRRLASLGGSPVPVYADRHTAAALTARFGFVFKGDGGYQAVAELNEVQPGSTVIIGSLQVSVFDQDHGFGNRTLGVRIGGVAYSTDAVALPDQAFAALEGLDLWIVDCVQETPHPTHANLETALAWIERVKPRQAVLTHLGAQLDYNALCSRLPTHVRPAYDGMVLKVAGDCAGPEYA